MQLMGLLDLAVGYVTFSEFTKVNTESYMGDIIKQTFSSLSPC